MSKVLVVYAAPTPIDKSHTAALANRFLDYYTEKNPDANVKWLNLNKEEEITNYVLNNNNSKEFYDASDKYIDQLKDVDHLIIATPMNNFNISTLLKNYIDHIAVAKKTFEYKYDGFRKSIGLLTNLKVQILATQGAPVDWYPFSNFVKYLEGLFDFLGCTLSRSILIDGTKTAKYKEKTLAEIVDEYNGEIKEKAYRF